MQYNQPQPNDTLKALILNGEWVTFPYKWYHVAVHNTGGAVITATLYKSFWGMCKAHDMDIEDQSLIATFEFNRDAIQQMFDWLETQAPGDVKPSDTRQQFSLDDDLPRRVQKQVQSTLEDHFEGILKTLGGPYIATVHYHGPCQIEGRVYGRKWTVRFDAVVETDDNIIFIPLDTERHELRSHKDINVFLSQHDTHTTRRILEDAKPAIDGVKISGGDLKHRRVTLPE